MNTLTTLGIAGVAALLVTAASAWTDTSSEPADTPIPGKAPEASAPAPALSAGTIKGRVEFDGEKPESKPVAIAADAAKGCCAEGMEVDPTDQTLLIDDKNGIANVVVTLTVEGKKPEVPAEPIHLDQKCCKFEPHVLVVPAGGSLQFLNSDGVSHNIHTYSVKASAINQMVSGNGNLPPMKLDKPEPITVKCDIHTWMNSVVFVTDASAWAVSKPDGTFEISLPDLAPGKYTLEMWHEKLGKNKQEITVAEGGACDAGTIKWSSEKKDPRRRK